MLPDCMGTLQIVQAIIAGVLSVATLCITAWSAVRLAEVKQSSEQAARQTDRRQRTEESHPNRRSTDKHSD